MGYFFWCNNIGKWVELRFLELGIYLVLSFFFVWRFGESVFVVLCFCLSVYNKFLGGRSMAIV